MGKTAFLSSSAPSFVLSALSAHGFCTELLKPFPCLPAPVASHADCLFFTGFQRTFTHREYYAEAAQTIDRYTSLSGTSLCLTDDPVFPEYPYDVRFNAFALGGALIGRVQSLSPCITDAARAAGYRILNTKQGYAACSALVLGNAVISADACVLAAAAKAGAETLQITPGGIQLPGYDCGFIGGACGVCGSIVYFCGDIMTHPDGAAITAFCTRRGYSCISLGDGQLFDCGSVKFV